MLASVDAVRAAGDGQVGECPFFMKQPRQPAAENLCVAGRPVVSLAIPGT